jgi:uncharacterized protein YjbJ (UPF0337 family)
MNNNVMQGKWKQIKGEVKSRWGKLTDDEVDRIGGDYDKLVGKLQERYGYTEAQAKAEAAEFAQTVGDTRRN